MTSRKNNLLTEKERGLVDAVGFMPGGVSWEHVTDLLAIIDRLSMPARAHELQIINATGHADGTRSVQFKGDFPEDPQLCRRFFVISEPWDRQSDSAIRAAFASERSEDAIQKAAKHPGILTAGPKEMADAICEALGCFGAAVFEGLEQALLETDDERLKDLIERRVMYALQALQATGLQPSFEDAADIRIVGTEPPALRKAAQELADFACSALTADCEESKIHFNKLMANLRAALAQSDALTPVAEPRDVE